MEYYGLSIWPSFILPHLSCSLTDFWEDETRKETAHKLLKVSFPCPLPPQPPKPRARIQLSVTGSVNPRRKKKCRRWAVWNGSPTAERQTYPKNWAPDGPTSTSRLANPSPSTMGGGLASLCLFTRRQVMRVGAVHLRGGMTMRMPLCRLPRIEPPRASTMKLTRKLQRGGRNKKERGEKKREWASHFGIREASQWLFTHRPRTCRQIIRCYRGKHPRYSQPSIQCCQHSIVGNIWRFMVKQQGNGTNQIDFSMVRQECNGTTTLSKAKAL